MKTSLTKFTLALFLLLFSLAPVWVNGQARYAPLATEDFTLTVLNMVQPTDHTLEFDVYLLDTDPLQDFELGSVQLGFLLNSAIYTGGTLSATINNTGSGLNAAQQFTAVPSIASSVNGYPGLTLVRLAGRTPPGYGNGTIISAVSPGTLLTHFTITSTVPFTANSTANLTFTSSAATNPLYGTKLSQYIGTTNTPLVVTPGVNALVLENPVLNPSATLPVAFNVTGGGAYCQGSDGLPVGLSGSEIDVTYTLYKDAVAQVPTIAGTGEAISFGNQLFGTYTVSGTNTGGTTEMTGSAVITETASLPVSVSVATDQNNVCSGTSVTLTATPVNGGTPTYQWYKNAAPAGTNQATYTYTPANNDQVYVIMTSDLECVTGNPATSNTVVLTVNELLPVSVSVVADQNNVCSGTSVTLTATPVNGGTPTYQWYKNAAPAGTNQATYTYIPVNGDLVYVVMTSDLVCVSGNPATSNTVTMVVTEPLIPSVTITASENPVTAGTLVTFTATPVNGGTPTYEWFVNSISVGNGATYSYIPENGDQVYVVMTSSLVCVTMASVGSNTIIMTVSPVVPVTTTWTGAVNSDWFNPGNWGNGVPGAISMVTIPGGLENYPTLDAPATIAGITINNDGSFIGSEFLTTGSALVKRDIVNADFHFISSPVAETTFGDVFPLNQTQVWAREYNETTGDWDNLTIADALTVGKGYSVQMTQPQTALFEGVLNSNPVTMTLAKQNPGTDPQRVGWNLLGNPFTSAIDWDLTDHANVDGAVYVWNGTQYVSWNGSIGALSDGIIPAQNSFFAKTMTDGVTMNVPLSARVHSNQGFYKQTIADMLEVTAEGNGYADKAFVHFNNEATAGFDSQFDAYKLFGNENAPQLYNMISGASLSINELPMAGNEVVDLGFKCNTAGIYSITTNGTENFAANVPVILQDVKLNVYQDLKTNPVYSFSYMTEDDENRFKLWFQEVTAVNSPDLNHLRVYSFGKTVVIENNNGLTGEAGIFDITGRQISSHVLTSQSTTQIPVNAACGTYIVKIITVNGPVNAKVFIR
jgi:hypothetical protein